MNKITLPNNIYTQEFLWEGFKDKIIKFHDWLSEEESYPSIQTVEHVLVITRQYRTIYRNLIEDNPELKETTVGLVGESLKALRKKLVPFVKEYKKGFIESGRQSWLM
jgi:nitrate reductase alpha subunit